MFRTSALGDGEQPTAYELLQDCLIWARHAWPKATQEQRKTIETVVKRNYHKIERETATMANRARNTETVKVESVGLAHLTELAQAMRQAGFDAGDVGKALLAYVPSTSTNAQPTNNRDAVLAQHIDGKDGLPLVHSILESESCTAPLGVGLGATVTYKRGNLASIDMIDARDKIGDMPASYPDGSELVASSRHTTAKGKQSQTIRHIVGDRVYHISLHVWQSPIGEPFKR